MSRPSHATQQQKMDDSLTALPAQRWRWLFTPDPRWLNTVNTTALRTVNAIRMFIGVTILWALIELTIVVTALTRCRNRVNIVLGEGESLAKIILQCEESLAGARLFDFAASLFQSYGLLLAAMAGIAVAESLGKRATDTEHRERVERAKKAPIITAAPMYGGESQAPTQEVNVNVDKGTVTASEQPDDQPGEAHRWRDPNHPEGEG